jgi:hypothetical protein
MTMMLPMTINRHYLKTIDDASGHSLCHDPIVAPPHQIGFGNLGHGHIGPGPRLSPDASRREQQTPL